MKSNRILSLRRGHLKFSKKKYNQLLKEEVFDTTMDPQNQEDELESFIDSTESLSKTQYAVEPHTFYWKNKLNENTETKPKGIWNRLPDKAIFLILDFLKLRDLFSLYSTSKAFKEIKNRRTENNFLKLIESHYSERNRPTNPNAILNFRKSLKYSLKITSVFSSQNLFTSEWIKMQELTYYLSDFGNLKESSSLDLLKGMANVKLLETLFLSLIRDKNEVTLWIVTKKEEKITPFIIQIQKFDSTKEILSAKFCNDEFLIIKNREKQTSQEHCKTYYKYEIKIIDIEDVLENFCDDEALYRSNSRHKILIDFCSTEKNEKINILNFNEEKVEIEGQNDFLSCFSIKKNREYIILYTKTQNGIILLYNLRKEQIENVYLCELEFEILEIIISKKQAELNSLSMVLIDTELRLYLLKYNSTDRTFYMEEIKYGNVASESKDVPLSKEYRKYQYGAVFDSEKFLFDYIIVYKYNKFYYIRLDSIMAKRVTQTEDVEKNSINSWTIFEDLIAIMYEKKYVAIFKITSQGNFIELSRKKQLILYESSWTSKKKRLNDPINYIRDFTKSKIPPYMLMNHSYLIILNFPFLNQGFQIFFTSLQEIIMNKIVWKQGLQLLNAHRTAWEVYCGDICNRNPEEFFTKYDKIMNYGDLVKFEDNKMLLMFESLNLFFSFQSPFNFTKKNVFRDKTSDLVQEEELERLDIEIPLKPNTSAEKNSQEHQKKDRRKFYQQLTPNKNHMNPLKTEYDNFGREEIKECLENDDKWIEEDFERETDEKSIQKQSSKSTRKKVIRSVIKRLTPIRATTPFLIKQFGLSIESKDQKEWYLRRISKRKTNNKKTFKKNIRMENGEA